MHATTIAGFLAAWPLQSKRIVAKNGGRGR
jgi:hypothetical protein